MSTENYENLSKEDLIEIAKQQHQELVIQERIIDRYAKHLEKVIEYNSVETYRQTVEKNREVAKAKSLNDDVD